MTKHCHICHLSAPAGDLTAPTIRDRLVGLAACAPSGIRQAEIRRLVADYDVWVNDELDASTCLLDEINEVFEDAVNWTTTWQLQKINHDH